MTFRILTVCTGNICRSPMAELLLAGGLSDLPEVEIHSAGTGALVGAGMPNEALRILDSAGYDGRAHRSRQVTPQMIQEADLVLAMARDHRRSAVELAPAATRRTFTLRELARVSEYMSAQDGGPLEGTDVASRLRSAVRTAAGIRGMVPHPATPVDLDIIDPYRRSDAVFQQSFDELAPAAGAVVEFLSRSTLK